MMKILRTILPAVLLLTFLGGSALAQTKVATVDMRQLFENYWKTKRAQASLQDSTTQLTKDESDWKAELQKASDEYQQLLKQEDDTAVSAEERGRRKQAADDKRKQLEDRRAAIESADRSEQARITDQMQHMSEKILAEITAGVTEAAKGGGYTMVLNSAAETINLGAGKFNVPSPVIYSVNSVDLTADVLKQLNASAPIDLTPSSPAPGALPLPSLLNTNRP